MKEKSINCVQNWYTEVFEVPDHDFDIRSSTFKLADPILRSKNQKVLKFFSKLVYKGIRSR